MDKATFSKMELFKEGYLLGQHVIDLLLAIEVTLSNLMALEEKTARVQHHIDIVRSLKNVIFDFNIDMHAFMNEHPLLLTRDSEKRLMEKLYEFEIIRHEYIICSIRCKNVLDK
jgi:hypothetical protein